jgi:hypothetical protein
VKKHIIKWAAPLVVTAVCLGFIFRWKWPDVLHGDLVTPLLIWAGMLAGFSLAGPRPLEKLNELVLKIPAWAFGLIISLAAGAVCTVISLEVYDAIPHVQDEINYYFQGKIFASGQLYLDSPKLAEFFSFRFMVNDGRLYSLFQPGWPALLAIGHLFGVPHLVAPALASVATGLFFGTSRRLLGEVSGRWATLLLLSSSVFLFQQSSMMSHGPAATFGLGALYFAVRFWQQIRQDADQPEPQEPKKHHIAFLVAAGACLGYLFCIRAGTAVAMAIPFGLAIVYLVARGELSWKVIPWVVLGGMSTASLQFLYNWIMSGDLLTFPQARYFELTEPIADCHRLGIGEGIGCRREHGPDLGPNGFTWTRAVEVTHQRMDQLRWDFFGTGFGVALVSLPFFSRRIPAYKFLLLGFPLSLVGLYFFYYYHGNCFGARYYYEAVPACIMLIAAGFQGLFLQVEHAKSLPRVVRRVLFGAVLATALFFPAFSLLKERSVLWERYGDGYWGVDRSLAETVEKQGVENAVVVIPGNDKLYRAGFWLNEPGFDTDIIVTRDHGKQNSQLKTRYPDRDIYRFHRQARRLNPLHLDADPDRIFIEGEAKFPPLRREGGYVTADNIRRHKWYRASGDHHLFFDAKEKFAFFEFEQYVFKSGTYQLEGALSQAPDYGIVQISIEGEPVGPTFDGRASKIRTAPWKADEPIELDKGMHTIRVEVVDRDPSATGWRAGLDYLELVRHASD